MKTIKDEWESYAKQCVPATAGQGQRDDTRRAFYGGAVALWSIMNAATDGPEREPTLEDLRAMEALDEEVRAFIEEVKVWAAAERRARN